MKVASDNNVTFMILAVSIYFTSRQFVLFTRRYNTTPTVLVSANHNTTITGNSAPIHNGIATWIEVKCFFFLFLFMAYYEAVPRQTTDKTAENQKKKQNVIFPALF